MVEETKKKNKIKKGRVIRVTPDLQRLIEASQEPGESIPSVIKRLLGIKGDIRYVLPSDLYETKADARGAAVLKSVKNKSSPEKPLEVRIKNE